MKLQKILNHKYFLYAAYALMVVNLLGYLSVSSVECIVVCFSNFMQVLHRQE